MTHPDAQTSGARFVGTVGALTQLSFAVQRLLDRIAADHGLSLIQGRLLVGLLERRPTMSELASQLYLERSSMTGLVARAESHGLVQHQREGGLTRVRLTEEGRTVGEQLARSVIERLDTRTRALRADERQQLVEMAERLIHGQTLPDETTQQNAMTRRFEALPEREDARSSELARVESGAGPRPDSHARTWSEGSSNVNHR